MSILVAIALVAASCTTSQPAPSSSPGPDIDVAGAMLLIEKWDDLDSPVFLTSPPSDDRIFVVEQGGAVLVAPDRDSKLDISPYVDLTGTVATGLEQGLLGLAFAPDFKASGRFYLNFTDTKGNTQIDEFTVDPTAAPPAKVTNRRTILSIDQPFANHNGGNLAFGPDGLLYIGTGDGGNANDPNRNAQNNESLLGKMLRLDIGDPDNIEIYANGLRNPWRYSFDPKNGDLWIGDVGQNMLEEIDVIRAGSTPIVNLGWPQFEGDRRNQPGERDDVIPPIVVYDRSNGECAVTGGYVYRGPALANLQGQYVFADFCTGEIWSIDAANPGEPVSLNAKLRAPQMQISSFGVDASGRLYVVDLAGSVWIFADHGPPGSTGAAVVSHMW